MSRQPELPIFGPADDGTFVPADNKLEAVTRIAQLTGARSERLGPGSKERKSALTGLVAGLSLDVDGGLKKPALARAITESLGGTWGLQCESRGDTITLVGLNRVLEVAEAEVARRRAARPGDTRFIAARSKFEAVTRIASLTGAPEQDLGPGSKERKSVLVNLATDLELNVQLTATKHELGRQIANVLGATWDSTCQAPGQTITLIGLNRILEAASASLVLATRFRTPGEEGSALARTLADRLRRRLDGRTCVEEMRAAEHTQWAQDEWLGFYFEFVGLPALLNDYSGGPVRFGNTIFDYSLDSVWDLKAHARHDARGRASSTAPLNDTAAIDACLSSGRALGFLILSGDFTYDDGEFRQWQRDLRVAAGKKAARRVGESRARRASKPSFTADVVEAVHIPDHDALRSARDQGVFSVMNQGRQANGAPRRPKYSINLRRATQAGLVVAAHRVAA